MKQNAQSATLFTLQVIRRKQPMKSRTGLPKKRYMIMFVQKKILCSRTKNFTSSFQSFMEEQLPQLNIPTPTPLPATPIVQNSTPWYKNASRILYILLDIVEVLLLT